jgi:molybdopterin synthase sulfur carrier subunit
MPLVFIPSPMRDLTGGAAEVPVEGATVGEVVDALERRFPGARARLCRGDALAPGLQVSVDHVMTRRGLAAAVRPDSEVHFLPAIGGGGR